jgi:ribosomal protein S18 acetylase RimI-like enzyme
VAERVRLRPLREDELPVYIEEGKRQYAADLVSQAGFSAKPAERKAERDWANLLPGGKVGEGHFLFAIEEVESGQRVGVLWFARRDAEIGEVAFVYDIHIDEDRRGRGLGRAAMLALEDEVRKHGLKRISLNVFGGNTVARGLYTSLGYAESAVWMTKGLSSARGGPS